MEGTQITDVRDMTDEEYDQLYWPVDNMGRARAIELSDGTVLIPSQDPEGNGAGAFHGIPHGDEEAVVGATIEAVQVDMDADGGVTHAAPPELVLSTGRTISLRADPEGNGPGALYQIAGDETYIVQIE
jgi:hypothetical protein